MTKEHDIDQRAAAEPGAPRAATRRDFLASLAGGLGAAAAAFFAGGRLAGALRGREEKAPPRRPSGPVDNIFEPISNPRTERRANPQQESK